VGKTIGTKKEIGKVTIKKATENHKCAPIKQSRSIEPNKAINKRKP